MERQKVRKTLETIDYEIEGTFDEAIAYLIGRKAHYDAQTQYSDIKLEVEPKRFEEGNQLCITGARAETDTELAQREKEEENRLSYQRAEYERLKKQFEGK